MNNTTISSDVNTSLAGRDDVIPVVTDYVGSILLPVFFVVGLVGNLLTISIMSSRAYRQLPVSKFLIALSLSDILVNLLTPFNKSSVRQLLGTDLRALSPAGCKLYFWAYRFSRLTSSWMVVMICCERFVAVWAHIKAKHINTTRNAYIIIALIYGGFAIYSGYTCSWSDRIIDGVCIINSRLPGLEHKTRVFLAIGLALYSLLPSLVLIILTSLLVFKLIKLNKKKPRQLTAAAAAAAPTSTGGSQTPKENKGGSSVRTSRTNIMLLSVVVAFIVLITPNALAHLVSFSLGKNIFEANDSLSIFLRESSQIMEQLNHSINFVLYIISSKRFRDGFRLIFKSKNNRIEISTSITVNDGANVRGRQS